jgi:hypothetical protein
MGHSDFVFCIHELLAAEVNISISVKAWSTTNDDDDYKYRRKDKAQNSLIEPKEYRITEMSYISKYGLNSAQF